MIVESLLSDKGILDDYLAQMAVPLINFISKSPEQFKTASFNGQTTCMDLMFSLIGKIFKESNEKNAEMDAMCAVTLINAILENVPGIESGLPNIIDFFIKEMG